MPADQSEKINLKIHTADHDKFLRYKPKKLLAKTEETDPTATRSMSILFRKLFFSEKKKKLKNLN